MHSGEMLKNRALKKLSQPLIDAMVKTCDFRTIFTKTSSHVLKPNGMSQENHKWRETYQGSAFFVDGVSKIVDSHRKPPRRALQVRSGGANCLCACVTRMRVRFFAWAHARALNVLSILHQATEFAQKIERSLRPIFAGWSIIKVQNHSLSSNFGAFSDRIKRPLDI